MRPRIPARGVDVLAARRAEVRALVRRSREVILVTAALGVVVGLLVAAFDEVVTRGVDVVVDLPLALAAIAPGVGLVVAAVALRLGGPGTTPGTADEFLAAYHDPSHRLGGRRLVARLAAATATLGAGGAMGMEGPSLYSGAALTDVARRRLPRVLRGVDPQMLLVAGAAAGVAAIFKAPTTGVVFALEVPQRDSLARPLLLPALVAAASSYLTFVAWHGTEPLFAVQADLAFSLRDLLGAVALGLLAGLGARAFARALRWAKHVAVGPAPRRLAAASAALVALCLLAELLTDEPLTLGSGYAVVAWAREDHGAWVVLGLLGLRALATVATVAGGGVGGIFIPLVVAGTLLGRAVGGAVHPADTGLFTVVGAAAFLGAGYRVPLASVVFVAETTGRPGFIVPGLLAAVAAELVMGEASVSAYQRPSAAPVRPLAGGVGD